MLDNPWLVVSAFLAGVVVTLLGSWATHSVTQEQLKTTLSAQAAIYGGQLDVVKAMLKPIELGQDKLWKKLDSIQSQLDNKEA